VVAQGPATIPARDQRTGPRRSLAGTSPAQELGKGAARRLAGIAARRASTAWHRGFAPHDLRHQRVSLLHRQGKAWAEIGRFVGQRNLSVTADTYRHVLVDGELDYASVLV